MQSEQDSGMAYRTAVVSDLVRACPDLRQWREVRLDPVLGARGGGLFRVTPATPQQGALRPASLVARFVDGELLSVPHEGKVPEHDSRVPYVEVAVHLERAGLAVPHVFGWDRAAGVVLVSDLGDVTLDHALATESKAERDTLLRRAVQLLVRFQHVGYLRERDCAALSHRLSGAAARRPLERVVERAVAGSGEPLDASERVVVDHLFDRLLEMLGAGPEEVLHGEFRGHHILLADDTLWLVGFEGVRLGPFAIDLATFLLDALPRQALSLEADLVSLYAEERRRGRLPDVDEDSLWDAVGAAQIYVTLEAIGARSAARAPEQRSDLAGWNWLAAGQSVAALPPLAAGLDVLERRLAAAGLTGTEP